MCFRFSHAASMHHCTNCKATCAHAAFADAAS